MAPTNDNEVAPLKYQPLPTPTSIRVLKVLPPLGSEIHCALTTVDLNGAPVFDALSYTWGNPITIYEKPRTFDVNAALQKHFEEAPPHGPNPVQLDLDAWNFRSQHPFIPFEKVDWDPERRCRLICNGDVVMVTQNLYDALFQIRRRLYPTPEMPDERLELMAGAPMSTHLWVDMVCINQDDVYERNAQIRIMGRIFESANIVFGWIGPEANLSRRALATMGHFFTRMLDMPDLMHLDKVLPPDMKTLFSIEGIVEADVYAIFALFQRLWFRRAWVIQEAVFANRLLIACGGVLIQWGTIQHFVSLVHARNLYRSLSIFSIGVMTGQPTCKVGKHDLKAGFDSIHTILADESLSAWDGKLEVDPLETREFVAGVGVLRQLFGRPVILYAGSEGEEGYSKDQSTTREQEAITSSQEAAQVERVSEIRPLLPAPPGWHETLLKVCRPCMATDPRDKVFSIFGLLEKTGSLLPEIPWDYRSPVDDLYRITVLAIIRATKRLDILAQVQDPSRTKIEGLPSWVPDFSVSLGAVQFENPAHPFFSASGEKAHCDLPRSGSKLRLPVEGFFIDNVIDVAELHGCYFARTARIVCYLPPRYHPRQRATPDASTRSQAYWRTLVGEIIRDDSPATLRMGFGFSEWITEEVLKAFQQLRRRQLMQRDRRAKGIHHVEPPEVQARYKKLEEKIMLWQALTQGEPEEYIHVDTTGAKEVYVTADKALRFIPDASMIGTYLSQQQLLGGMFHHTYIECPESGWKAAFMARMAEVKQGHRMFRTPNNYLGMGPISSQVGDEVWVLKGARTPFILRRRVAGQYELIGEAYVHGIMHGEAVKGSFKPTPLELV